MHFVHLSKCPKIKERRLRSRALFTQKSKLPPFGSTNFFTALKGPKIGPRSKPYACPKLLAKSTHAVVLYLPREKPCHTIVWEKPRYCRAADKYLKPYNFTKITSLNYSGIRLAGARESSLSNPERWALGFTSLSQVQHESWHFHLSSLLIIMTWCSFDWCTSGSKSVA